jgi:hypothetical protein
MHEVGVTRHASKCQAVLVKGRCLVLGALRSGDHSKVEEHAVPARPASDRSGERGRLLTQNTGGDQVALLVGHNAEVIEQRADER